MYIIISLNDGGYFPPLELISITYSNVIEHYKFTIFQQSYHKLAITLYVL